MIELIRDEIRLNKMTVGRVVWDRHASFSDRLSVEAILFEIQPDDPDAYEMGKNDGYDGGYDDGWGDGK